jgi:hypothetical protein
MTMPNEPDDLDNLEWHAEVLRGISIACRDGKHEDCPGRGEDEGQMILCVCSCHKVPPPA